MFFYDSLVLLWILFRTNELMNKVVEKSCVRQGKKGGALIEIVS